MKCCRLYSLTFCILISFFCFQPLLYGQRPGIECGCENYAKYKKPGIKPILTKLLTVEEGSSKDGKYIVEATTASPPNTVNLKIFHRGKKIFNQTNSAVGWGFSPNEDRFVMHGYDQGGKHWCTLLNLDPDPGRTGEEAESWQVIPSTEVSSARISFSPHGHYLVYAALDNVSNLLLQVFNTKNGDLVYNGSTSSRIVGLPDGESIAGWGFSSDSRDASFVHAYLTDATHYRVCVKELASSSNTFILETNEIEGGSYWRFSPCGDIFLWMFNDIQGNHVCRFYKTNQENTSPFETETGVNFRHAFTQEDGHYIEYISGPKKIFDNTADNPCDDNQKPSWSGASLDTSDVTGTSMKLQWSGASDNNGVTQYRVYMDQSKVEELEAINQVEISGLPPDSTFDFKVEAGDAAGNWSTNGPSDSFSTKEDNPPYWPAGASLSTDNVEGVKLTLDWSSNEAQDDWGVEFYRIYCNGSMHEKISGETTRHTVTGLTPEETYTFRVEAGDAAKQWTEDGPEISVDTKSDAPPYWLPEDYLSATDITETTMLVLWPKARDHYGVTGYRILLEDEEIGTSEYDTCYLAKDLEEGTMYNFKIIAQDEAGNESEPLEAYLWTLSAFEELPLIVKEGDQKDPDIDNITVAWQDDGDIQSDIYTYDLYTDIETHFTDNTKFQDLPRVSGERMVWVDFRTGNGDIYLYDPELDTVVICPHEDVQSVPDICGDNIVWAQLKSGEPNNWDIYRYNIKTGQKVTVCDAPGKQTYPSISGNMVVWEDYRDGNADIYLHFINELNTENEYAICVEPSNQRKPVVHKYTKMASMLHGFVPETREHIYSHYPVNRSDIYFQDDRNGDWDIYMVIFDYNFIPSLGFRITDKNTYKRSNQVNPHVHGNTLVYQDDKNGDWDILAIQNPGSAAKREYQDICTAQGDQVNPRTSNGRIVWEDYRNGDADIYIWDRPPGSDLYLEIYESQDPVGVGRIMEYWLVVTNGGPDMNKNVEVDCQLPLMAEYKEHSVTRGSAILEGNQLKWHIPELRTDSIAVLSCKLQTCDLGTLTFSAEASGDAFDLNPSNNKVFEKTNVRYIIPSLLGHGEMPDMKTQEDGHVHVVYFSNDALLYAHKLYQGNWEIEKLATLKEYTGQSCALALDSENKVHIMYSVFDWESSPGGKMYQMWQDEQGEWKKVITAINEKGFSRIKVETGSQDEFHLVYQEGEKWYSYAPVMYLKTIEKEWTAPYLLEQEGYSHVDIALDEQDKPHVCYYAVNKGIVYHYCQDPDAGTWSQAEIIEPDWGGGQLEGMVNSISLDSEGNPNISYVGNIDQDGRENIKHARKQYGHWTINKVDGGDFGSSGNGVYAEDPGKAHFIYNHFPSGEIRYATNVNGPWIRQSLDHKIESGWFRSTLIDQDLYRNNHLVYEKDENIFYALRRPVPVLEIHPDTLDFGSVPVDSTKRITVFLKNADNRRMTVDSAVIKDYDCFEVEKTFEVRLDPGETDGMYVHFSPTSEGLYDTHMKVYYDAPTGIFMEIPILARSEMPLLRVRPDPVDFGAIPENTEGSISVYLINEGEKELTFDEITVEKELWGTVYPTDFSLVSNTCDALAAGDSCEVIVAFKPQSQGAQYSYLNISSNDPAEPEKQIRIDGRTPLATISLSKSLVDFGYVEIDGTATEEILINNTGETDIQIFGIVAMQDPDIDQFTFNHSCTVIPPGEACPLTVGFMPTKTGDMEVQISIATNAYPEDTYYITLRGSSIKRELSISTHLIDFGTILTGEEETADITLENAGTTDIIIEQIELTGRDVLEFSSQTECGSLGSGEQCTATVKFIPVFEGNKKADLIVHSNDSDHPKDTITLTGIAGSGEEPLSLSIQANVTSGEKPLNVNFTSQVTGGSEPYTFVWDFNDGNTSTAANPIHTFETQGYFMVTATVTDIDSDSDSDTIFIDVSEKKYIISGNILDEAGETPINEGVVELYQKDSLAYADQVTLSAVNTFEFGGLESGHYTVKVMPDTLTYPETLPTWLGDQVTRSEARYVNLDGDSTGQDIHVAERPGEGSGSGTVEGTFSEDETGQRKITTLHSTKTQGTLVSGCYVFLYDPLDHSLKASDITSGEGAFTFRKLEAGDYEFYADFNGMQMDESNPVLQVTSTNDTIYIAAVAGTDGISVEIEMISNIETLLKSDLKVYPIPVTDQLVIEPGNDNVQMNIETLSIIDLSGRLLYNYKPLVGSGSYTIDMSAYMPGMYLLRIKSKDVLQYVKVIKN